MRRSNFAENPNSQPIKSEVVYGVEDKKKEGNDQAGQNTFGSKFGSVASSKVVTPSQASRTHPFFNNVEIYKSGIIQRDKDESPAPNLKDMKRSIQMNSDSTLNKNFKGLKYGNMNQGDLHNNLSSQGNVIHHPAVFLDKSNVHGLSRDSSGGQLFGQDRSNLKRD